MKNKIFIILLLTIAFFCFFLRLQDYDQLPPFKESMDEFIYPWAGMSLIQTGTPVSWSPFVSYPKKFQSTYWGVTLPMVSPYIEKPFLYPLITGMWSIFNKQTEFDDVRLATLRLIPIFLSFISIILVGLLTLNLFDKKTALLSAVLYATIPTIVLGNRLSLTENLIIPISLFIFWILTLKTKSNWIPHLVGFGCGLTLLTKQTGIALPLAVGLILITSKQWQWLKTIIIYTFVFGLIFLSIPYHYGWNIFLNVTEELRRAHTLGLPETIYTLFRIPGIGHKESIFYDGSMLLGWILLFSSPLWLSKSENKPRNYELLLSFPFVYLTLLFLGEGGQTWYGWHLFPLYPFIAILSAKAFIDLFDRPDLFQLIFFYVILSASSLRFIMLITDNQNWDWSKILGIIFGVIFLFWQIPSAKQDLALPDNVKIKKTLLMILFLIYIAINIYTVINLKLIYPSMPQPLN